MLRSINYRVQLLICQYGVCYLHVKSKNRVKLCKFYVVDSRFNPILGVNSAYHLGLLKFTKPMFENWTDTTPIKSSELNINAVQKTSKDLSPNKSLSHDKVSNVSDIPVILGREWSINHKKYKHLFHRLGHFKCTPISIEMQEGSIPVRKPAKKVPLPLCKKF